MGTIKSCKCHQCVGACKTRIGWFKFGEAEILAKNMELTLKQLFDKHLMVDFWEGVNPIYLLSPSKVGYNGQMTSYNPKGACSLLKNGLCAIHNKGKPFECANSLCTNSGTESTNRHELIAKTWDNKKAQKQIEKLLDKKPECPIDDNSCSIFNMF